MSCLASIYILTPNTAFSDKSAFEPGLLFFRDIHLIPNLTFYFLLRNPTTKMCVSTLDHFSVVLKTCEITVTN